MRASKPPLDRGSADSAVEIVSAETAAAMPDGAGDAGDAAGAAGVVDGGSGAAGAVVAEIGIAKYGHSK